MKYLEINKGQVKGVVPSSPSKSYTHRAFILSLLSEGTSVVENPLLCDDTIATLKAVQILGARVYYTTRFARIQSPWPNLAPEESILNVDNSGTTLRFLCGVASLMNCYIVITGDASLRRRPIQPLLDALHQLGGWAVSTRNNGLPPVIIRGPLSGTRADISGDISSQFISSLLIVCPLKSTDTLLRITGGPAVSLPYVDMTLHVISSFGGKIRKVKDGFAMKGGQSYKASQFRVPGDFSSASILFTAAAITGGEVTVENLYPDARQADRAILDILSSAGATVEVKDEAVTVRGGDLQAIEVDCSSTPDLFPLLAALGACARGKTRLYNARHVRYKESDRIQTMSQNLRNLGAKVTENEDGIEIEGPQPLKGAELDPHGDHRIFMTCCILGLVAKGSTKVLHPMSYTVSYPRFMQDLESLGVKFCITR